MLVLQAVKQMMFGGVGRDFSPFATGEQQVQNLSLRFC